MSAHESAVNKGCELLATPSALSVSIQVSSAAEGLTLHEIKNDKNAFTKIVRTEFLQILKRKLIAHLPKENQSPKQQQVVSIDDRNPRFTPPTAFAKQVLAKNVFQESFQRELAIAIVDALRGSLLNKQLDYGILSRADLAMSLGKELALAVYKIIVGSSSKTLVSKRQIVDEVLAKNVIEYFLNNQISAKQDAEIDNETFKGNYSAAAAHKNMSAQTRLLKLATENLISPPTAVSSPTTSVTAYTISIQRSISVSSFINRPQNVTPVSEIATLEPKESTQKKSCCCLPLF